MSGLAAVGRGGAFAVAIGADEDPRDVFHHPYAYAAWRGIDTTPSQPADDLLELAA
jgi:hypothetical protein